MASVSPEDVCRAACEVCASSFLVPKTFFVAWNGVLVLVFEGFPPPLVDLKSKLNESGILRPENFGSKWPKATLAAQRDGSPPLTFEQLAMLKAVCEEPFISTPPVRIESLTAIHYTMRSLEARGSPRMLKIPLSRIPNSGDFTDGPSLEECEKVAGVLAEWGDLPAYLEKVNDAGSRISTYREASPHGATLVAFLPYLDTMSNFKQRIEALLPGHFEWMDPESVHCTIRSLDTCS